MKTLVVDQKCFGFILVTLLILSLGTPGTSYGAKNVGEPRTVRLFYFLPNDRPYRQEIVDDMKTGILEVQSFFSEQMAAHGHGNKTFQIETDDQGDPIVHRIDADYADSHYVNRGYTEGEIARAFDNSANVQLIVMDISRSSTQGSGVGDKKNGWGIIRVGWDWFAAAHELGHAFGLQHDFRDNSGILSYGRANRASASLSKGAADFLSVHPYFNSAIPLEIESPPTFELLSPRKYPIGAESVPIRLRVRDDGGLHQVIFMVNTKRRLGGGGAEVKIYHKMAGETDTIFEFDYDGLTPSDKIYAASVDAYTSLSDPLIHPIYFIVVDTEGNNSGTLGFTQIKLEAADIQTEIVPVSERTPQVRDAIVATAGVNSASDVTAAHLAEITSFYLFNKGITALKTDDFDGFTALTSLNLQSNQLSSLPVDIFDNLSTLTSLDLWGNQFTTLPSGIFDDLTALTSLKLGGDFTTLPSGIFDNLTALSSLDLSWNQSNPLPSDIFDNLSTLTSLTLWGNSLSSLPVGILDNLTGLRELHLRCRSLSSLPSGIFDNLTALVNLELLCRLSTLPVDIFDNLTALRYLSLYDNPITTLPKGVFDNLTALKTLSFEQNRLTTLPLGIFDRLTALTRLNLRRNGLNSLPIGIFTGLTALENIQLHHNPVNPLPLAVSLEKVGGGQFKAVAPAGAPFAIVLPLTVTDGSITGGATTLTIPAGSVESDTLTVTRTPGATDASTVDIGILPGIPSGHQGYVLFSGGLPLVFSELGGVVSAPPSMQFPISERTTQVRDAIIAASPGVNSADDVTEAHLAAITRLNLSNKSITSLKAGDFDGLSALTYLSLSKNQLMELPAGVFSGLSSLTKLYLWNNQLSSLPVGVFDGLSALTDLSLYNNDLSSLPSGIFDDLTALTYLNLQQNRLTELPVGVFDGLSELTELYLNFNVADPFPLTVSFEKVADGQFKAVAPSGAPFSMMLPITVANGSITSGATTLTIPAGSVESEVFTVTRTPGTTFAVNVNIGTLPGLPVNHYGYTLVKSDDLPLTFTAPSITPVSQRTQEVQDAIVARLRGVNSADDVTEAHLAVITHLNLIDKSITSLKAGDFDGLSGLTTLYLHSNQLTSLPAGVFDGLSALTQLDLDSNQLTSLPAGVFDGLSSVVVLGLSHNQLTSLPSGVFDELSALTNLVLHNNQLTLLPAGVFDGLSALTQLDLKRNQLTSLPTDVFDELSALTELWLNNNQLTSLSVGAFNGLSSLTQLLLNDNQLTTLPAGVFDGLSALTELWLNNNQLTSLSAGVFDELPALTQLYLDNNQLTSLSSDVFDGLSALTGLLLNNNQLTTLSADVFDGLSALTTLHLHNNQLTSLQAKTFDELAVLKYLHLEDNRLASLSAGVFDGLSALTQLWLNANQLTSLSAGVFDRLSALTILYLHDNQLTTLSAGVFDGLSALTQLWLNGNVVAPMPLTVSLEQVGTDQFKAVAPAGAPFEIVLPVSVTNGTIIGGATTVTIPAGSVESDTLTVTRTAGTSDDITVDIGTVPGIPSNHNGYALVKSTDLPLTFTAPSETTLMAIKGTVTTEDGTPAEAGLQVTVTIGSDTKTAVSEAGGGYSVIFLSTQGIVATSGDTVTVHVLNANTGATAERTVPLSREQITATQATVDLQFLPTGSTTTMEYELSVPTGISLIHVPLEVTAVDGVAQTLESVADLYDALGGASKVSLLITLDPQSQQWRGYFGTGDRGSSADKVLTDDLGIIAVLIAPTSVQLSGDALGTNGSSTITVHPGMNLVGVPLNDSRITRMSDLLGLEGMNDNITLAIVSDNGEFKLTESAGDSGDIAVTGGQSFILVAQRAAPVEITGVGWSNVSEPAVAPSMALTGIEVTDITPVLAVSGSILPPVGGASLPRLGVTDFSVTVKNLSTGRVDTAMTDDDGVGYRFTFVDTETGRAAQVGDILELSAHSADPLIGVHPVRHTVTVEDVKRSHIPLGELVAYEIPAKTELLLNYPNPFNPETWIPYRLAKDAFVTVTIYDQRGRVVRDIAVGHRIAAVYESRSKAIYWDGRTEFGERVASGLYFYTLTAGDYAATRKMVILK